jgi:lipopolysaccharide transport system permease protein
LKQFADLFLIGLLVVVSSMSISDRIIVINAGKSTAAYWKELWLFRELLWYLAWRDILVRYKQTTIGIAWSLIRPLLTVLIFTFVFGHIAGLSLKEGDVPYPVLVFAGVLPWQFFATAFVDSSNSLITNSSMISKVYFPRLIVPGSSIVVNLVDFFIALMILFVLMLVYDVNFTWRLFLLPFFLVMALLSCLGLGIWFSALNSKYRDFRYIIPFIVQIGLYVSPVGFSSNVVPEKWRLIYSVNPMVGVIDGFRWVILGERIKIYWPGFIISCFMIVVVLIIAVSYFRKTEKSLADII